MELYDVVAEIERLFEDAVDSETGEIIDVEALNKINALEMERDELIEQMALEAKNSDANAKMLQAEANAYEARAKREKNKAAWIRRYLTSILNGDKFESLRVSIGWRKSTSVELDPGVSVYDIDTSFVRMSEPELSKREALRAMRDGIVIPGLHLEERQNIQIK